MYSQAFKKVTSKIYAVCFMLHLVCNRLKNITTIYYEVELYVVCF